MRTLRKMTDQEQQVWNAAFGAFYAANLPDWSEAANRADVAVQALAAKQEIDPYFGTSLVIK